MARPTTKWTGTKRRNVSYGRLSKTRKLLRRLPDEATEGVKRQLASAANDVFETARFNILANRSVRTRNLLESLRVRISPDGLSARVGLIGKKANRKAFYGRFVEFGTKKMPAKPFLTPAWEENRNEVRDRVQAEIQKVLKSIIAEVDVGMTGADVRITI